MADGKICKNCGYQEAAHDLGQARLPDGEECFNFEVDVGRPAEDQASLRQRLVNKAGMMLIGEPNSEWDS